MTTAVARTRLARPGLRPLVDELARRLGDGPDPPVRVTLRRLSAEQRDGLADLLGAPRLPPATVHLPLARLCTILGLGEVGELRAIVEELRGPIDDRRAARDAARAERESLWGWLTAEVDAIEIAGIGPLRGWPAVVRREGVRGGVARHRRRLEHAVAVLGALPGDSVPLAAFADDVLGDPHALDRGRSVGRLVLSALAHARGQPTPSDAETARELWETAGVAPDPLSSTALVLGLTATPGHPLEPLLTLSAEAVEPVVLTLAQLRRWPLTPMDPAGVVYVVENPSLLVAAAAAGWPAAPIVCSSGRPTVAVVTLLRQLGAGGATILQHADFDATGLAITAWLAQRAGTIPWHMSVSDYRAAVGVSRNRVALRGTVPPSEWDPELAEAVRSAGVVVHEEELRIGLLEAMRLNVSG